MILPLNYCFESTRSLDLSSDMIPWFSRIQSVLVSPIQSFFTVGAAMILANVLGVTPKPSKHYINITKRNVVEVFHKDTVLESGSG
uniref:Homologous recombination OB-fold protein OB-fold domain-containing protein n=1 Tax=Tanacetum cinerariifolium TaxID=118510 RepID=A0A6L2KQ31_TANCI|nr:hypothetical protein [Tanacetum cinerariifolium]